MEEISYHWKDNLVILILEGMTNRYNGNDKYNIITHGCEIVVKWKDGSTIWEKLKYLKEYNPIDLEEYIVVDQIVEDPTFNRWAPHVLSKNNQIIYKLKNRYFQATDKYGICLPQSVYEALGIYRVTGVELWSKVINKYISKVKVSWKTH